MILWFLLLLAVLGVSAIGIIISIACLIADENRNYDKE